MSKFHTALIDSVPLVAITGKAFDSLNALGGGFCFEVKMDAKVVNSVSLKDEMKTFMEVEKRNGVVRITINGANNSVSLNLDKEQAISFFYSCHEMVEGR